MRGIDVLVKAVPDEDDGNLTEGNDGIGLLYGYGTPGRRRTPWDDMAGEDVNIVLILWKRGRNTQSRVEVDIIVSETIVLDPCV